MKVTPVSSPHAIQQVTSTDNRSKAIAAFNAANSQTSATTSANTPQQSPVLNQNQVGVEELGAIQVAPTAETTQEIVETTTSEDTKAVEETPKTPETDPVLSRQFAQLARQEKALRAKAQQQDIALKAREEAIRAREEALTAKSQTQDMSTYISKDKLKADPLTVLAEAGLSYDEITQQILTQQPRDPRTEAHIARLEAKLSALEEANDSTQKSYKEQQATAYQNAIKQITTDAKKLVSADPNFETIKATGSVKDVVELITSTFEKGMGDKYPPGTVMTVEEAAEMVEEHLFEEAMKITQIDKIKKRLAQTSATQAKVEVKTPATVVQPQPMKTLTNATASQRQLSAKERAILAFKGELKS